MNQYFGLFPGHQKRPGTGYKGAGFETPGLWELLAFHKLHECGQKAVVNSESY